MFGLKKNIKHKYPTHELNLPEDNNNRTFTASDNHQSLPDHQSRGNYHTEVQHLVIQLQEKILHSVCTLFSLCLK